MNQDNIISIVVIVLIYEIAGYFLFGDNLADRALTVLIALLIASILWYKRRNRPPDSN